MKILLPTNFTELSNYTMGLAETIANNIEVEVHFVNVINAPDDSMMGDQERTISAGCITDEIEPQMLVINNKILEFANKSKLKKVVKVIAGDKINALIKYIKENGIDIVLLGTHGSKGFKEFVEGSLAEKIVRLSPVPVLCIKEERHGMSFKNIMIASQLIKNEHSHLKCVKTIQKAFNSTLHLVKVSTPKHFDSSKNIKIKMEEYIKEHTLENVKTHVYCDFDIEKGIENFANDYNIDLVTIGDHGFTGLQYVFRKSISKDIVNHLHRPVLTFKID